MSQTAQPSSPAAAPSNAQSAPPSADALIVELGKLLQQLDRGDLAQRATVAAARLRRPATIVCVVGEFKQGKSSLVNALLGADVCPVDDDLATSAITLVRYGDQAGAIVRRKVDGKDLSDPIPVNELGGWVSEVGNPKNHKGVERVEVTVPSNFLKQGLVIVDTPPTRNALDFLDAPGTLARFIDHPLFRLMMMPTRRGLKVLNIATQPVLKTIGKVVGGDVVADAVAFFQAFAGMETGFRHRADEVITLLHGPRTRYLLVASPRADTVGEARFFAGRLQEKELAVAAVVVNRCTPDFGAPPARRPRGTAAAALHDNLAELHATAEVERAHVGTLLGDTAIADGTPTVFVPTLPSDVHTLDGLAAIRGFLHDGPSR